MKIYTKTGDSGETGLFAGPRVPKDHPRVAAYGEVDELNAALGVVRAEKPPEVVDQLLESIQHDLFTLGTVLATPDPEKRAHQTSESHIAALEAAIDEFEEKLPPLREFILPSGNRLACLMHLARTICRRAERSVTSLAASEPGTTELRPLIYLNRLSDLLFVLARFANHSSGEGDVAWRKPDLS